VGVGTCGGIIETERRTQAPGGAGRSRMRWCLTGVHSPARAQRHGLDTAGGARGGRCQRGRERRPSHVMYPSSDSHRPRRQRARATSKSTRAARLANIGASGAPRVVRVRPSAVAVSATGECAKGDSWECAKCAWQQRGADGAAAHHAGAHALGVADGAKDAGTQQRAAGGGGGVGSRVRARTRGWKVVGWSRGGVKRFVVAEGHSTAAKRHVAPRGGERGEARTGVRAWTRSAGGFSVTRCMQRACRRTR
jgi:hypothetical protein